MCAEYVVKVLDPRPEATVAIVIDLKGISFWKLASLELFGTIREISDVSTHATALYTIEALLRCLHYNSF